MAATDRADVAALRARCDAAAADMGVERLTGPAPPWTVVDGSLANTRSEFFRVTALADPVRGTRLVLEQPEHALVGLVVADGPSGPALLLSIRAEPGLVGGACLSTTVQSTPSNYLRRHGGASTPMLAEVLDAPRADVLHESLQLDWHDLYVAKAKRYRVVRIPEQVVAPPGLVWVPLELTAELLRADDLVTNDLRAVLVQWGLDRGSVSSGAPALEDPFDRTALAAERVPIDRLPTAGGGHEWRDGWGRHVAHVAVRSGTREVARWSQPLLVVPSDRRIALHVVGPGGAGGVLVARRPVPELGGWVLLDVGTPTAHAGTATRRVLTSAEGGRFLHHRIMLEVHEHHDVPEGWDEAPIDLDVVRRTARASLATALTLRLALSLLDRPAAPW